MTVVPANFTGGEGLYLLNQNKTAHPNALQPLPGREKLTTWRSRELTGAWMVKPQGHLTAKQTRGPGQVRHYSYQWLPYEEYLIPKAYKV